MTCTPNVATQEIPAMSKLQFGLIQLRVGKNKQTNITNALSLIGRAKKMDANIVALPECFNAPYGTEHFQNYAEEIPNGETSQALSQAAMQHRMYIIGGTITERENSKLYNTCTVWSPTGDLIAKHRKVHLFDIDIPNKITFHESDTLSAGDSLTTFQVEQWKIGLGICYDIRFEEMARLYRNQGCHMLVYPAAFNMVTGPLHWSLLQRARANDNQLYVTCISPARGEPPEYVAWGHTQMTDPWGTILLEMGADEDVAVVTTVMSNVVDVRRQIPTFNQRRTDLYDTVYKQN